MVGDTDGRPVPMHLPPFARSLSAKLLLLTIVFVMIAEVLIYLPSAARFRADWLAERLAAAHLAVLAVEAAPDKMVTAELEAELLRHVGALSIEAARPDRKTLMLGGAMPPQPAASFDLRAAGPLMLIRDALMLLVQPASRIIVVTGLSPKDPAVTVAIVLDDGPLGAGLRAFSIRILILSLVISGITAGLVYLALLHITVRPMRRLVEAMMAFKRDPESADPADRLAGTRGDEVGIAQRELIAMQAAVRMALRQRERLATLGTAVTKINHDIRGVLSSATLMSERLLDSRDPAVVRDGPRILASLERAAQLVAQTLDYARDGVGPAVGGPVDLHALVGAVLAAPPPGAARDGAGGAVLENRVDAHLRVPGDRDQLFRALANLVRNAVEAGARRVVVDAVAAPGVVRLRVADDGPGLPEKAQANLFRPFAASTKANGTGLGLAIAREVALAHGGALRLAETSGAGTVFVMTLPIGAGRSE